ncbi:MAG: asparagine synthase (glutamine-hydrolyzing) [Chloroflexi bacterium]|nr:asparagine synthase (glutamine-hydrolyzing) [Chloroflexota bacterium]
MCGICGIVYFDRSRTAERPLLEALCDNIHHRGPDQNGFYLNGPVGLGSVRLSIIDVAGGKMPIANEDGSIWIVYNGEVYNFTELRPRLEKAGHKFETHSDTETIVHLYEEIGDEFPKHLNGMFACAIWDDRRQRLVIARDHVGIKPVYYANLGDRLVFGSEIKAMLDTGISREIDPIGLHDYLSLNYVPGPNTIFKAIKKLQPGHMLTYEAETNAVEVKQYWDIPRVVSPHFKITDDVETDLLNLLRTVVQDQLISDVPLGAFLSGGVDSSLVVALMSEVTNQPVKTFSVGFAEKSYDESPYARIVAERFRTDHHEIIMNPDAQATVDAMVKYFDEPFADSSSVAVYAVSELARQHVKVALSGDGGDEVFGGYATYQADKIAALYRRLPQAIGGGLVPNLVNMLPTSDGKVSFDFKAKRFVQGGMLAPLPAHAAWKAFMSESMKEQLYAGSAILTKQRPTVDLLQGYYDAYNADDVLNRLLYVDSKVQLADDMLVKVDRMSMAHSLEVRVPLLDTRLVEWMAKLPSHTKINGMKLKYLLKRVAAKVLPAQILERRKAGFSVPIPQWLKTDLRPLVNQKLSVEALTEQGFFNPQYIATMLSDHWAGRHDYSRQIWNLLMFSMWYERYGK